MRWQKKLEMRNTDATDGNERQSENDALDLVLDAALREYAAAEPRAGLEQRVLAQLQCERVRLPNRSWWTWSVAGVVAALLAFTLALALRSNGPAKTVIQRHPPVPIETVQPSATQVAVGREIRATPVTGLRQKATWHHAHRAIVVADSPKLDQFPSPEPLTSEELALVRYVRQFPHDAVIVASAQEEFEKEIQQAVAAGGQVTSNSVEQER